MYEAKGSCIVRRVWLEKCQSVRVRKLLPEAEVKGRTNESATWNSNSTSTRLSWLLSPLSVHLASVLAISNQLLAGFTLTIEQLAWPPQLELLIWEDGPAECTVLKPSHSRAKGILTFF